MLQINISKNEKAIKQIYFKEMMRNWFSNVDKKKIEG